MFRRFIAITFALIFTVVTVSAFGQGIQIPEVVFLFCQGNPETGDTEVCDMESSDQSANPIPNGTRCVDALAFFFQEGFESVPAMVLGRPPGHVWRRPGFGLECPGRFEPGGNSSNVRLTDVILAIPLVKINKFDPLPQQ